MMAISSHLDLHHQSGGNYVDIHSPTGSSEDSVEVKCEPITVNRNKRKLSEPKKAPDAILTGPLKKRVCYQVKKEKDDNNSTTVVTPFRPWSPPPPSPPPLPPPPVQDQPVALIKKVSKRIESEMKNLSVLSLPPPPQLRVPIHPPIGTIGNLLETDRILLKTTETFPSLSPGALPLSTNASPISSTSSRNHQHQQQQREQRNYKNMTRERRIEANARERTRVHTISAAFETLRRAIPSYSHNQKLSKLSVLRVACTYIRALSNIVSGDDSGTAECVDSVTKTIQKEGKLRKKKDDSD